METVTRNPSLLTGTLLLIRHAPLADPGRLAGRRDVAAVVDPAAARRLAALAGPVARVVCSPARRCRDTAAALWPGAKVEEDARLWEQDFGRWEGLALDGLPDLGVLDAEVLAQAAPHGGESFAALCARTIPALEAWAAGGERVAVVAHAGTVRAGLARALGGAGSGIGAALAFRVAPLSLTVIDAAPGGWSVACVNLSAP